MITECKIVRTRFAEYLGTPYGVFMNRLAACLPQIHGVLEIYPDGFRMPGSFNIRATISPEKSYIHQPFIIKFLLVYTDCTTAL